MKKIVLSALFILLIIPMFAQVATIGNDYNFYKKPKGGDTPTVKIFPNPVVDYFEVSDDDRVVKLVVFNLAGKEMKRFDAAAGQKYYISDLPKGLYLVQLLNKDSQTIVTQRVSKR